MVAQIMMGEMSNGISWELGSNLVDSIKTPMEATHTLEEVTGK